MFWKAKKTPLVHVSLAKQKVFSRDPFFSGAKIIRDKVNKTLVNTTFSFELDFLYYYPFQLSTIEKFYKLENKVDF